MLRKVMLAAIGFALLAGPAFGQAQKAKIVASCGSLSYDVIGANDITMDSTGVLCTSAGGGGSSSTPFTPNGNYQTLTATASSSASTALPAGTTVAYQNPTAVDVSCVLATGAATATTNKIIVRANSTVFVAVGSNVNTACINQTGAASNTIVLAGGTGLGTNFRGGRSGGGGGAATIADGADVAEGATTDAVVAAGAAGSISAKMRRLTTDIDAIKTASTAAVPVNVNGTPAAQTGVTQGTTPSGNATPAAVIDTPLSINGTDCSATVTTSAGSFLSASRLNKKVLIKNEGANVVCFNRTGGTATVGSAGTFCLKGATTANAGDGQSYSTPMGMSDEQAWSAISVGGSSLVYCSRQ